MLITLRQYPTLGSWVGSSCGEKKKYFSPNKSFYVEKINFTEKKKFGCTCSIWKFAGQIKFKPQLRPMPQLWQCPFLNPVLLRLGGSNPCFGSNPSCCRDNTRSLTCCTTVIVEIIELIVSITLKYLVSNCYVWHYTECLT